jgi:hypothetical protein
MAFAGFEMADIRGRGPDPARQLREMTAGVAVASRKFAKDEQCVRHNTDSSSSPKPQFVRRQGSDSPCLRVKKRALWLDPKA